MVSCSRLEGRALFEHPLSAAVMSVLHERGYELANISEFTQRSGMSRTDLERQFSDKADVTLRVFEAFIDNFEERVKAAYDSRPTWPDNLRAAAYETVRWITEHPDGTWFGMVGMLEAGDMALVRREEVFKWCAALIDEGRAVAADPDMVPRAAPLMAIGAIVEMLRRQQEGSLVADPVATVPRMMYSTVRPYLGEEAALRELEIPPPADLRKPRR